MTMSAVRDRVREVIHEKDWEEEYYKVIVENGGVVPRYPDIMIQKCYLPEHYCGLRVPPQDRSELYD